MEKNKKLLYFYSLRLQNYRQQNLATGCIVEKAGRAGIHKITRGKIPDGIPPRIYGRKAEVISGRILGLLQGKFPEEIPVGNSVGVSRGFRERIFLAESMEELL